MCGRMSRVSGLKSNRPHYAHHRARVWHAVSLSETAGVRAQHSSDLTQREGSLGRGIESQQGSGLKTLLVGWWGLP